MKQRCSKIYMAIKTENPIIITQSTQCIRLCAIQGLPKPQKLTNLYINQDLHHTPLYQSNPSKVKHITLHHTIFFKKIMNT